MEIFRKHSSRVVLFSSLLSLVKMDPKHLKMSTLSLSWFSMMLAVVFWLSLLTRILFFFWVECHPIGSQYFFQFDLWACVVLLHCFLHLEYTSPGEFSLSIWMWELYYYSWQSKEFRHLKQVLQKAIYYTSHRAQKFCQTVYQQIHWQTRNLCR